jgi:hypothetical protein
MRSALRLALLASALLPVLAAAPAAACSVISSYRVPTNLELVERADLIILGTAESHAPSAREYDPGDVVIRPVALLKGESLPSELRVGGYLSDDPRRVFASDPRDLFEPNPGALTGACGRYGFRRGMLLLLFLVRNEEGGFRLAPYPFARTAEDVPSPDAPWARAVRLYVEISALPESARRGALEARRDALRAARGDRDAALLADDIDRQLSGRRIPPYD